MRRKIFEGGQETRREGSDVSFNGRKTSKERRALELKTVPERGS